MAAYPTQARLKEMLSYDPATGVFTWRIDRSGGVRAGDIAGSRRDKHATIGVDGSQLYAHRLACLYMTGDVPAKGMHVDHINRDGMDNRWDNLRVVSHGQNMRNRDCFKGYHESKTGFTVTTTMSFRTEEEAIGYRDFMESMRFMYENAKNEETV